MNCRFAESFEDVCHTEDEICATNYIGTDCTALILDDPGGQSAEAFCRNTAALAGLPLILDLATCGGIDNDCTGGCICALPCYLSSPNPCPCGLTCMQIAGDSGFCL